MHRTCCFPKRPKVVFNKPVKRLKKCINVRNFDKKLIGISVVCIKGDREGSQGTKSLREREHCRAPANNKSFKMCLIQHKIVKKKGFKKFYFMFLLCIPPPPTSSLHFQEAIKHLFGCDAPKLYKNLQMVFQKSYC